MLLNFLYFFGSCAKFCLYEPPEICPTDSKNYTSASSFISDLKTTDSAEIFVNLKNTTTLEIDFEGVDRGTTISLKSNNYVSHVLVKNVNNFVSFQVNQLYMQIVCGTTLSFGTYSSFNADITYSTVTSLSCKYLDIPSSSMSSFTQIIVENAIAISDLWQPEESAHVITINPVAISLKSISHKTQLFVAGDNMTLQYENGVELSVHLMSIEKWTFGISASFAADVTVILDFVSMPFQKAFLDLSIGNSATCTYLPRNYDTIVDVQISCYDNSNLILANETFPIRFVTYTNTVIYSNFSLIKAIEIVIHPGGNLTIEGAPLQVDMLRINPSCNLSSSNKITAITVSTSKGDGVININANIIVKGVFFCGGSTLTIQNLNLGDAGKIFNILNYYTGYIQPIYVLGAQSIIRAGIITVKDGDVDPIKYDLDKNYTNGLNIIPLIVCPESSNLELIYYEGEKLDGFKPGSTTTKLKKLNGVNYVNYSESPLAFAPTVCIGQVLSESQCIKDPKRFFTNGTFWTSTFTVNSVTCNLFVKEKQTINLQGLNHVSSLQIIVDSVLTIDTTGGANLKSLSIRGSGNVFLNMIEATGIVSFQSKGIKEFFVTNSVNFQNIQNVGFDGSIFNFDSKIIFRSSVAVLSGDCQFNTASFEGVGSLQLEIAHINYFSTKPNTLTFIANSRMKEVKLGQDELTFIIDNNNTIYKYPFASTKKLHLHYYGLPSDYIPRFSCVEGSKTLGTIFTYNIGVYQIEGVWPKTAAAPILNTGSMRLTVYCESYQFPIGITTRFPMQDINLISNHDVTISYDFVSPHYDFFPFIWLNNGTVHVKEHEVKYGGGIFGNHSLVIENTTVRGNYEYEYNAVDVRKIYVEGNTSVYVYDANLTDFEMFIEVKFKQEPPVITVLGTCTPKKFVIKVDDGARSRKTNLSIFCCEHLDMRGYEVEQDGASMDVSYSQNCISFVHYARPEDALPISLIIALSFLGVSLCCLIGVIIFAVYVHMKRKQRRQNRINNRNAAIQNAVPGAAIPGTAAAVPIQVAQPTIDPGDVTNLDIELEGL